MYHIFSLLTKMLKLHQIYITLNHNNVVLKRKKVLFKKREITSKNSIVDPPLLMPYSIWVCFARSSAPLIGVSILSTVRKAAKLAVYEHIKMRANNHHTPPTILPEIDLQMLKVYLKLKLVFKTVFLCYFLLLFSFAAT